MKGVRVISGRLLTAVLIDGMSWPLPEIELLDRLLHGSRSEEAAGSELERIALCAQAPPPSQRKELPPLTPGARRELR